MYGRKGSPSRVCKKEDWEDGHIKSFSLRKCSQGHRESSAIGTEDPTQECERSAWRGTAPARATWDTGCTGDADPERLPGTNGKGT